MEENKVSNQSAIVRYLDINELYQLPIDNIISIETCIPFEFSVFINNIEYKSVDRIVTFDTPISKGTTLYIRYPKYHDIWNCCLPYLFMTDKCKKRNGSWNTQYPTGLKATFTDEILSNNERILNNIDLLPIKPKPIDNGRLTGLALEPGYIRLSKNVETLIKGRPLIQLESVDGQDFSIEINYDSIIHTFKSSNGKIDFRKQEFPYNYKYYRLYQIFPIRALAINIMPNVTIKSDTDIELLMTMQNLWEHSGCCIALRYIL